MNDLLLSYYGDDFTGSTDVMEALNINGVPTVLFLTAPTLQQVQAQFPQVRAVGIAGVSRSMTPHQMDAALPQIFHALEMLQARFMHYKICSTFDSSPTLGSIGHAIDLAIDTLQLKPALIPLVVGVPVLARYVVFANLFAAVSGETYRIDRHPTMSKHPATPMHEADLRIHLAHQTDRSIRALSIHDLAQPSEAIMQQMRSYTQENDAQPPIVLFDTLDQGHLRTIGQALVDYQVKEPCFVAGSSGVEYALVDAWQQYGFVQIPEHHPALTPVERLIVMSGSASPVNQRQIAYLAAQGAIMQRLNTAHLIDPQTVEQARADAIHEALEHLMNGQSLVLYTALGSDDAAIAETLATMAHLNISREQTAALLGQQQGLILNALIAQTGIRRVCVAGGDTSGHTAHAMGITALEFVASVAPGAPLCRASASIPANHGIEIAFKGGQNGKEDYFSRLMGNLL